MSGIFISYRRKDGIAYAGRLFDWLADRFGEERIFMDIDTMKFGLNSVEPIEQAIEHGLKYGFGLRGGRAAPQKMKFILDSVIPVQAGIQWETQK